MTYRPQHKFEMYKRIQKSIPQIYEKAKRSADEIGIPPNLRGKIGATGAVSGFPALISREVSEEMDKASRTAMPLNALVDDLRSLVKDVYGDGYDAAPTSTCEAGLWTSFDVLAAPPMMGRGENYRARYIAPWERHMHHQGGYGRPFPPKYKAMISNRGVASGELGMEGKRQYNLDVVPVPLSGGRYEVHGIRYHVVPLLAAVDPAASEEALSRAAERQKSNLSAFASLGYDTPGYGYGVKNQKGTPNLQRSISKLAAEYDVPYIVDNAWGIPFLGSDPREIGCDIMAYSMDKASGSSTSGLLIGREDVMVTVRSALGLHGERFGTASSYGKAELVGFDPGKENIVGQLTALRIIRDDPKRIKAPIDELYDLVQREFAGMREDLVISKSYNSAAVEVNYQGTWEGGRLGIPIFSIEDFYAGSEPIMGALRQMGIVPTISYDANIMLSPGLGTLDENGALIKENMGYVVRAVAKALQLVCEYAGVLEFVSA